MENYFDQFEKISDPVDASQEQQPDDFFSQFEKVDTPHPSVTEKTHLGPIGQAALGAIEGTQKGLIGRGISAAMKYPALGAAYDAAHEFQEADRMFEYLTGEKMPSTSKEQAFKDIREHEKENLLRPHAIAEKLGFDTSPQTSAEAAIRGAGAGAAMAGPLGALLGGGVGYGLSKADLPEPVAEGLQDLMDLAGLKIHTKSAPLRKWSIKGKKGEMPPTETIPALKEQYGRALDTEGKISEPNFSSDFEAGTPLLEAIEGAESAEHQKVRNLIDKISPEESSDISLGKSIREDVIKNSEMERAQIKEAYDKAAALQKEITTPIRKELITELNEFSKQWRDLPKSTLPASTKKAIQTSKDIAKQLVSEVPHDGSMKPTSRLTNNAMLMRLESNLNQLSNYDLQPSDTAQMNKLRHLLTQEIERSSSPEALEAYKEAKGMYKNWAEKYDNQIINDWRNKSKNQPHSMTNIAANSPDELLALNKVLSEPIYKQLLKKSLKKTLEAKSKKGDIEGYQQTLQQLEEILPPELKEQLSEATPKGKLPKEQHAEQILKKLNTISGIKELEGTLGKKHPDLSKAKAYKVRHMLHDGELGEPIRAKHLHDLFKDSNNKALLKELMPPEEFQALEKIDKKLLKLEEEIAQLEKESAQKEEAKKQKKARIKKIVVGASVLALGAGAYKKVLRTLMSMI